MATKYTQNSNNQPKLKRDKILNIYDKNRNKVIHYFAIKTNNSLPFEKLLNNGHVWSHNGKGTEAN